MPYILVFRAFGRTLWHHNQGVVVVMYRLKELKLLIILTPFDELQPERTIRLFRLAATVLSGRPLIRLGRVFVPLALDAVLVTVQRRLEGPILQNNITPRYANVEPTVTAESPDLVNQLLSGFESTVQIHLNVLLEALGVVLPHLLVVLFTYGTWVWL